MEATETTSAFEPFCFTTHQLSIRLSVVLWNTKRPQWKSWFNQTVLVLKASRVNVVTFSFLPSDEHHNTDYECCYNDRYNDVQPPQSWKQNSDTWHVVACVVLLELCCEVSPASHGWSLKSNSCSFLVYLSVTLHLSNSNFAFWWWWHVGNVTVAEQTLFCISTSSSSASFSHSTVCLHSSRVNTEQDKLNILLFFCSVTDDGEIRRERQVLNKQHQH